jgi:hypothetical protein
MLIAPQASRAAVASLLLYYGIRFIAYTISLSDLLLNVRKPIAWIVVAKVGLQIVLS